MVKLGVNEKGSARWQSNCLTRTPTYRMNGTGVEGEDFMAKTISKTMTKAQMGHYRKVLEAKAHELRTNMLTPAAANIVARREEPVDVADLSTQSHEEWIFLNRNSLDISLL